MNDNKPIERAQEIIARSLTELAEARAIREEEQVQSERSEEHRLELLDGEDTDAMHLQLARAQEQILGRRGE